MMRTSMLAPLACVLLLSGCSSLIESRLTSHQYRINGMGTVEKTFSEVQKEICTENSCVKVLDITGEMPLETMSWVSNIELRDGNNTVEINDEHAFDLNSHPKVEFPVVVLFPGYGMTRMTGAMPLGFSLRDKGYPVIIAEGPTEGDEFSFGLAGARSLADWVKQEYPDRPVVSIGLSMGALALTEFNDALKAQGRGVASSVLIASMLDFEDSTLRYFEHIKRERALFRFVPRGTIQQAVTNMQFRVAETPESLNLENRVHALPQQTLIMAATADQLVPINHVKALFRPTVEEQLVPDESNLLNGVYKTAESYTLVTYKVPHVLLVTTTEEVRIHIEKWLETGDIRSLPSH